MLSCDRQEKPARHLSPARHLLSARYLRPARYLQGGSTLKKAREGRVSLARIRNPAVARAQKGCTMLFWAQFAFATVAGFTTAALAGLIYQILADQKPSFARVVETNWQGLHVIFLAVLAGPWIIATAAIAGRAKNRLSSHLFVISLLVAALWSLCFGIVVIGLFSGITS